MIPANYKILFLFDGAPGIGKTELVFYLERQEHCPVLKKFAYVSDDAPPFIKNIEAKGGLIRAPKEDYDNICDKSSNDVILFSPRCPPNSYVEHYWITVEAIQNAFEKNAMVCMICRDFEIVKKLKHLLPQVKVVSIFVHLTFEHNLPNDPLQENIRQDAAHRQEQIEEASYTHMIDYDHVIICYTADADKKIKRYIHQLRALIEKYSTIPQGLLCLNSNHFIRLPKHLTAYTEDAQNVLVGLPYSKNVLIMTSSKNPSAKLREAIDNTIHASGLNPIHLDDPVWKITSSLDNSRVILACCKFAIAIFALTSTEKFISNECIYEIGCFETLDRICVVFCHADLQHLLPSYLRSRNPVIFKSNHELVNRIDQQCISWSKL